MSTHLQPEAREIIKEHVLFSMGAGLIPLFILDIIAITAIQMDMIRQLCRHYSVDYQETKGKAITAALTGSTLGRLAGYGIGSALKVIPGLGSLLGGVTLSVAAGASTYALGQVFATHFQTGGSIFDLDPEAFKEFYNEQMERGKALVKKWQEERKAAGKTEKPQTEDQRSLLHDLKEAEALKNAGALSAEEFEAVKEEILRRFMEKK